MKKARRVPTVWGPEDFAECIGLGLRMSSIAIEEVEEVDDYPATRFDQGEYWITAAGFEIEIEDMETTHIMNTIKLMYRKPLTVQNLIIKDLEANGVQVAWNPSPFRPQRNLLAEGIQNATSMTIAQTREYLQGCKLFQAFFVELARRGVNVQVFLENIQEEEK